MKEFEEEVTYRVKGNKLIESTLFKEIFTRMKYNIGQYIILKN